MMKPAAQRIRTVMVPAFLVAVFALAVGSCFLKYRKGLVDTISYVDSSGQVDALSDFPTVTMCPMNTGRTGFGWEEEQEEASGVESFDRQQQRAGPRVKNLTKLYEELPRLEDFLTIEQDFGNT